MKNVAEILELLKKHFQVSTDLELSKMLDVTQSTLSAWKTRDVIDIQRIYNKISDLNINKLLENSGNEILNSQNDNLDSITNYEITKVFEPEMKVKQTDKIIEIWSDSELNLIFNYFKKKDIKFYIFLKILYLTSFRVMELVTLSKKQIL